MGKEKLRKEVEEDIEERVKKGYKEKLDKLIRYKQCDEIAVKKAQKKVDVAEKKIQEHLDLSLEDFLSFDLSLEDYEDYGVIWGNLWSHMG